MPSTLAALPSLMRRAVVNSPYGTGALLLVVATIIPYCVKPHSTEWEQVYVATARHLVQGDDIYAQPHGYVYPPFQAFLALPWVFLPVSFGRVLWFAANVFCAGTIIVGAWQVTGGAKLNRQSGSTRREHLVFLLGLFASIWYLFHSLAHQQTDLVIGALVVGGCLLLSRRSETGAGALLGMAAAMKCTPLLWLPYLLWRRRWRAAGTLSLVAVVVSLLPDAIHRPANSPSWLIRWTNDYLRPVATGQYAPGQWFSDPIYNQSISGAINRWGLTTWQWAGRKVQIAQAEHPTDALILRRSHKLAALGLLAFGAVTIGARRRSQHQGNAELNREAFEFAVIMALMPLLSPMSSVPHFVVLVLPSFVMARVAIDGGRTSRALMALACLGGLLSNKDLWGSALYTLGLWYAAMSWQTLALMMGCCLAMWRRRDAINPEKAQADGLAVFAQRLSLHRLGHVTDQPIEDAINERGRVLRPETFG